MHQQEHGDGRSGAGQQSPESSGLGDALPHHAEQYGAKQRCDEESKERLHIIHNAGEAHHKIRGANANEYADQGAPAAHGNVMRIRRVFADKWAIEVVGPDGGESTDVAGHACHETRD